MKNRALIAALACAALLGSTARAQESGRDDKLEQARQHVAKAKVHYDLGEFKEAADEYIIVYRLRPIPALLFNIAQAYRQGGLYDKARQFYKAYLRESPDAKNKAMIEQSIREMDQLLAKEKQAKESPPTGVKDTGVKEQASLPPPPKLPADSNQAAAEKTPPPVSAASASGAPALDKAPTAPKPAAESVAAADKAAPKPVEAKPAAPAIAMATPRPSAPPAATPGTSAPRPLPAAEEGGFYTKWWFWTAVGVVAVGAGVAALTLGGNTPPTSHFGTNGI